MPPDRSQNAPISPYLIEISVDFKLRDVDLLDSLDVLDSCLTLRAAPHSCESKSNPSHMLSYVRGFEPLYKANLTVWSLPLTHTITFNLLTGIFANVYHGVLRHLHSCESELNSQSDVDRAFDLDAHEWSCSHTLTMTRASGASHTHTNTLALTRTSGAALRPGDPLRSHRCCSSRRRQREPRRSRQPSP